MKNIKKILVMVFVTGMLLMSCTVGKVPNNASTAVATETQVPATVTPTATLQLTSTPQPTITQTLRPGWIAEFAEPILKSISVRPPTYEDDFADPSSGWQAGPIPKDGRNENWGLGEAGYLDGEYYIETLPAYHNQTEWAMLPFMNDLVVEMDVRFLSVDRGDFQVHFRHWDAGWDGLSTGKWHGYMVNLVSFDEVVISHYNQDTVTELGRISGDWGCREFCHFLIIAREPEIAVYLDGNPVIHILDTEFEQYKGPGQFNLVSGNFTDKTTQIIHIDNFRLWDISNLP